MGARMSDAVSMQDIGFNAADSWPLAGTLYRGDVPQVAILISAGTGFPRRFYRHAARYFAARGAVVLTFDFRGTGESGAVDLAQSEIDYPDWGRLDMTAALETLEAAAPGLPLVQLGHSAGGMFAGFMENHAKVVRHAFVSVGTGFWGAHHLWRIPMELFFWWGFGPWELARYGYIRGGGLWSGEALPPKVFKTWRRWSQRRCYFKPDLEARRWPHYFDEVQAPICAWVFEDDGIATPKSARDTLRCYPAAQSSIAERSPKDFGVSRMGHEGAFRAGREALWAEIWDWLVQGATPR